MNVSGPEGYLAEDDGFGDVEEATDGDGAVGETGEALGDEFGGEFGGGFVGISEVSRKTARNISITYLTRRSSLNNCA